MQRDCLFFSPPQFVSSMNETYGLHSHVVSELNVDSKSVGGQTVIAYR